MVTTIRLPDDLHGLLKQLAEQKGMTFNAYLLNILWEISDKELSPNSASSGD